MQCCGTRLAGKHFYQLSSLSFKPPWLMFSYMPTGRLLLLFTSGDLQRGLIVSVDDSLDEDTEHDFKILSFSMRPAFK